MTGIQTTGRYAPSTTGPAHPGTLLAGMLCWLDARRVGGRLILRLENLDPERCRPEFSHALVEDLAWLGLDWDQLQHQSDGAQAHDEALDHLAELGLLYPCRCSRADLRREGVRAPDGGYRYANRCRARSLPARKDGGWHSCTEPLRVRLPEGTIALLDEGGLDLGQDPLAAFGDPVVRRRDGALAYHLACVVDDAESSVTRVVRGRDLATSTATQIALQRLLGLPTPAYRHHLLLLEARGDKLAKLHGAVGAAELRQLYSARELCGLLAYAAGLLDAPRETTPRELLVDFDWDSIRAQDRVVRWTGEALAIEP
jgi:glutamyl-Q tRNA(Asp) synthetase